MMRGKIPSFILFLLLAAASLTAAATTNAFTYQGVLRDSHDGVLENKKVSTNITSIMIVIKSIFKTLLTMTTLVLL